MRPPPDSSTTATASSGAAANTTASLQAIRERSDAIKAAKMRIFVRRGGPNYKQGLDMMRRLGDELGISIEVGGHSHRPHCLDLFTCCYYFVLGP